ASHRAIAGRAQRPTAMRIIACVTPRRWGYRRPVGPASNAGRATSHCSRWTSRPLAWARRASWWITRLLPAPGKPATDRHRASRVSRSSAATGSEPWMSRIPSGKLTAQDVTGCARCGRRRVMGVLLRGGQVMDPGAGLTGALDVRVRDGLVTEVRAGLAPDGDTVIDV